MKDIQGFVDWVKSGPQDAAETYGGIQTFEYVRYRHGKLFFTASSIHPVKPSPFSKHMPLGNGTREWVGNQKMVKANDEAGLKALLKHDFNRLYQQFLREASTRV